MSCVSLRPPLACAVVQFQETLEAEQARFIHRSVPTAALGSVLTAALVVVIFRAVVSERLLYTWFCGFLVLATIRGFAWFRFRRVIFGPETSRSWLRQATISSLASGALWGTGALFLFPEGQLIYQYTFAVALIFIGVACLFSYGPHNPTFLAFFVPTIAPGVVGMAMQGGVIQNAFAIGLMMISFVLLL